MKKIFRSYIFAAVLLISLLSPSCSKSFLDINPKGKLIAQNTSDYDLLLNNASLLQFFTIPAQFILGDEVAAVDPYYTAYTVTLQRQFRWDDIINEPTEFSTDMTNIMLQVYLYNKIINEVGNSLGGTDQQKNSLLGEALAGRAWCYFTLINFYGKPYNTVTSATDPGYPIVTAAEVTATTFTRASVKDVYDFIIKDLVTAVPMLNVATTSRVRMSRSAAEAFLGKMYVFMGRNTEALPMLNAAMTDMASAGVSMRLYDYNVNFATGGAFLPNTTNGPTYPTYPNIEEAMFIKEFGNILATGLNAIVASPRTVALYDNSDLRLRFFNNLPYGGGTAFPAGMLRKFGPNASNFGMRVPELYLLRAECKARLNDLTGAKADIEALRIKRMPAANAPVPTAIAAAQVPLLRFIMDERVREFAVEGFRWFDMRRLSVDPLIPQTSFYHTLYRSATDTTHYDMRPERLTLRLPQVIIDQNPGMQNNP